MPRKTGIEVTQILRAAGLKVGILIVSAYDDDPFVRSALQAGANGYMLKTAEPEELVRAVHDVCEGQAVLDSRLSLQTLLSPSDGDKAAAVVALTQREIELLHLVAQGFTNKAIAAQLSISDRTVQAHLANIFGKLNAKSRTDAVMIAIRNHWVPPG
jgi:DNA-binding NarL/FixJ family response regulator